MHRPWARPGKQSVMGSMTARSEAGESSLGQGSVDNIDDGLSIELQPHRDHNRAARSLHLLVQVPDDDSTMSVPSASATRYGRST